MQVESVKCECLHMFPITAPGQRAPLTQQELPKASQATDQKATSNRKSSFKDTRGVLALTERRANQRKGASSNLGTEEQYPIDAEGEKMERLTSFPHVNPYTESEDNVEARLIKKDDNKDLNIGMNEDTSPLKKVDKDEDTSEIILSSPIVQS